jgi:predicted nicotinamide N-methyase
VLDLVEETVRAGPLELRILRPPNADALIDEARFGEDEFMPYWAELWASGVALAAAVAARDLRGAQVLELGCGLGLPSVAAALSGARVLASDWAPEALEVTRRNAERNGARVETVLADWSAPEALLERAPFDLVLCADVLYEPRNVDALLALLPRLGSEVLLGEPGRPTAARFFEAAEREWTIGREGEVNVLRRRAVAG